MPTGTVVRFDRRRGYGFVQPEDGTEDVFVHQNNINMEGFRYLQVGEKVTFELEVGEKGMKAVAVALTEPRVERPRDDFGGDDQGFDQGDRGGFDRPRFDRPERPRFDRASAPAPAPAPRADDQTRRKFERLVSLLVEKGVLKPGELDGVEQAHA